jgi:hypothetical protein
MRAEVETMTVAIGQRRARAALLVLPHVILGGGIVVMLVVHPNAVRSAVMSTRAVVLSVVLAGAWFALALLVAPRLLRSLAVRTVLLGAVAVVGVVLFVVPTLHDTKVVERFPATSASRSSTGGASDVGGAAAPSGSAAAAAPVRISTGPLHGVDHDARGTVSVYHRADGRGVVALEDIDIEPGPDYHVYVVPGADRADRSGGVELAKLRGNQGTQYYDVPADRDDVGPGWTVLVWCNAFGVPVANATQHGV